MGTVPRGITAEAWNRARLKACHKHLIRWRGRKMVDETPWMIRDAFIAGYCDASDDVAKYLDDKRYCGFCGGVGTYPYANGQVTIEAICVHCRRGRKLLDALPQEEEPVGQEPFTLPMDEGLPAAR